MLTATILHTDGQGLSSKRTAVARPSSSRHAVTPDGLEVEHRTPPSFNWRRRKSASEVISGRAR